MPLKTVLSVSSCDSCTSKSFVLKDLTLPYNDIANLTGWGGPNQAISAIVTSTLQVTSPSGVVSAFIDVIADLPSVDDNDSYTYVPEDNGQAWEDGIWLFDWVVKGTFGGNPTYNLASKSILSTCVVKCCVQKLSATMSGCGCGNGGSKAVDAFLTYESIHAAYCCGNHERAKYLLGKLQDLCNNNCKGC